MNIRVAFLDVFHGDCAVVTFDEPDDKKACIVIDGGQKKDAAKRLAKYLKFEGIEVIDLLIATHIDEDHIEGLNYLLKSFSTGQESWNSGKQKCIRNYWGPEPDPDYKASHKTKLPDHPNTKSDRKTQIFITQSIGQNQDLNKLIKKHIIDESHIYYPSLEKLPPLDLFHHVSLDLLAPDKQILDSDIRKKAMTITNAPYTLKRLNGDENFSSARLTLSDLRQILDINAEEMAKIAKRTANNQSIVIRLTPNSEDVESWSFLFSGDAEQESWEMIRNRIVTKSKLTSRVLKVPHHGSVNGLDKESFKEINPDFSVISSGQMHGIPDGEILNLIKSKGNMKLFCTQRNNNTNPGYIGSCLDKDNCVCKTEEEFRSLRFDINCETGDAAIQIFKIENEVGQFDASAVKIWCPVCDW